MYLPTRLPRRLLGNKLYGFLRDTSVSMWPVFSPALLRRNLDQILGGHGPIVIGPWMSEVGYELLYWIPFLNWIANHYQLDPARVTVVSRGGVRHWYQRHAANYVDLLGVYSPEEYRQLNARRLDEIGSQKQMNVATSEREILLNVGLGADAYHWLHPSIMYGLFRFVWRLKNPIDFAFRHLDFDKLPPPPVPPGVPELPEDFVAVRFYGSECFPLDETNMRFVEEVVTRLAEQHPVVVIQSGLVLDDHAAFWSSGGGRVMALNVHELSSAADNLWLQSYVISKARQLVGTYGGFSYMGPFYGVPTTAIYSEANFLNIHAEIALHAFSEGPTGLFSLRHRDSALQ